MLVMWIVIGELCKAPDPKKGLSIHKSDLSGAFFDSDDWK